MVTKTYNFLIKLNFQNSHTRNRRAAESDVVDPLLDDAEIIPKPRPPIASKFELPSTYLCFSLHFEIYQKIRSGARRR